MSDLEYKLAVARESAAIAEQKLIEKEPRPSWRETPLPLAEIEAWLRREIEELVKAHPFDVIREAADVANMAAIYADPQPESCIPCNVVRAARRSPTTGVARAAIGTAPTSRRARLAGGSLEQRDERFNRTTTRQEAGHE